MNKPATVLVRMLYLVLALVYGEIASAGCNITIKVKNEHSESVTINWHHSEVKIKNGFWKDISSDLSGTRIQDVVLPGDEVSRIYGADFGCSKQRQYRFEVFETESRYWMETYPGGDNWTTKTTFMVKVKP